MKMMIKTAAMITAFLSMGSAFAQQSIKIEPPMSDGKDRVLFALQGQIEKIEAKESVTDSKLQAWTEVSISYEVNCSQKLENFSFKSGLNSDGEWTVFASAMASEELHSGEFTCLGMQLITEVAIVPGKQYIVNLVNLDLHPVEAGNLIYSPLSGSILTKLDGIAVDAEEMCPPGVLCITNGTTVTLSAKSDCFSQPFAQDYEIVKQDGKLIVYVTGAETINMVLGIDPSPQNCPQTDVQLARFSLINEFYTIDEIEVVEVR